MQRFSSSFSISEENGLSAGPGLVSPNLLGKDISMSTSILFGGAKTLALKLENPWISGDHFGYKLKYYYRDRNNLMGDFSEKANELYLKISSNFSEYFT